jgi:CBS domain-containing protein
MRIRDVLEAKDPRLVVCRPEDAVTTAADLMTAHRIGALPVRDEQDRLIGILSERDVAQGFARFGESLSRKNVRALMSAPVVTCCPEDQVRSALATMSRQRIRHLPVMERGALVGIVSQGDLLARLLAQSEFENAVLRDHVIALR